MSDDQKGGVDAYGIVANAMRDRVLRIGAKVWIDYCNGDAECPIVFGLSIGGRVVRKYTHYKKLCNFRAAWIPEHLRERIGWQYTTRDEAAHRAGQLQEKWLRSIEGKDE